MRRAGVVLVAMAVLAAVLFIALDHDGRPAPATLATNDDPSAFPQEVTLLSRSSDGNTPMGRIRTVDANAGLYAIEWPGLDGNEKSIAYHRPDAVKVTVSASVTSGTDRAFKYRYELTSLPSSGQSLTGFLVQTFASDVVPIAPDGVYVGKMGKHLAEFSEGA